MGYNPDPEAAEAGGRAEEGEYFFKVSSVEETEFKSGNDGCKIELKVFIPPKRVITSFEYLVYTEGGQWKIKQFLEALGFDYMRPPELRHLLNKKGKADFLKDEKGYLKPSFYHPGEANNEREPGSDDGKYDYGPPPMTTDDVPF